MNGISADIPREVRDILSDLSYIAGLPTGCKYNLTKKTYDQSSSWIDSGYRNWWKESKDGALDYINGRIDQAIAIGRKHRMWQNTICKHVTSLSDALTNFEHTYTVKYPNIGSDLNVIRLRIDRRAFITACQTGPAEEENPLANPEYYRQHNQSPPAQYSQGQSPPTQYSQGQSPPAEYSQRQSPPAEYSQGQSPPSQYSQGQSPPSQYSQGQSPPSQYSQGQSPPHYDQSSMNSNLYGQSPGQSPPIDIPSIPTPKKRSKRISSSKESSSSSPSYSMSESSDQIYHFEKSGGSASVEGQYDEDQSYGAQYNHSESSEETRSDEATATLPRVHSSSATSDSQEK